MRLVPSFCAPLRRTATHCNSETYYTIDQGLLLRLHYCTTVNHLFRFFALSKLLLCLLLQTIVVGPLPYSTVYMETLRRYWYFIVYIARLKQLAHKDNRGSIPYRPTAVGLRQVKPLPPWCCRQGAPN